MSELSRVDVGRRAVLLGGAYAAGLGLTGCSSLPMPPKIADTCEARPEPFLAGPEVHAAWAKPERYFDVHTHIFNARDVPVRQYLAKSVAHNIKSQKLREFIIGIAPVAELLSWTAVSPKKEYDDLCKKPSMRGKSVAQQSGDLDKEIDDKRLDLAGKLYQEILRSAPQLPALFNEASSAAKSQNKDYRFGRVATFSQSLVEDALRDGGTIRDPDTNNVRPMTSSQMSAEEDDAMSMMGVMQFVGFMLSPRHHNLRSFIRDFAEGSPKLPLSGCFAALVDFNYWLDSPSKSSNHEDQVRLHSLLSVLSGGFMLPLAPYNPWVDIKESDASLKLVKKAI